MSDIVIVALFCGLYVTFVVFYTSYVVGFNIAKRAKARARRNAILNSLSD